MRMRLLFTGAAIGALGPCLAMTSAAAQEGRPAPGLRPNILFVIADDWSWPHAGAYGDKVIKTPAFDRLAREGALFTHAFTACPSCTPSRAAVLTGQAIHRLSDGGNLHGTLPSRFKVYPDMLEEAGYQVGFSGKGWAPGNFRPGGRTRNPAGPTFKNLEAFMERLDGGKPFCFWVGSRHPHRPYEEGSGARSGLDPARVVVPGFLPDTLVVRNDVLDYYVASQQFDHELATALETLERSGRAGNTLVVATSDNGMPFPRGKANLYDAGTRMPLAIRWPGHVRAGLAVNELVSHTDFAPTFLEVAGLPIPRDMTGQSLLPLLRGEPQRRDRVFVERERHANVRKGDLAYPARAIRTKQYLYIHNYRPDRWPAGDPEKWVAVGPFGDIDSGPTKQLLLDKRDDAEIGPFLQRACGKRPAEELYDVVADPAQLKNLAGDEKHVSALRDSLDKWLRETRDPLLAGGEEPWDKYAYYGVAASQPAGQRRR